ncbi:MAG TPA: TldD/PmbA family protein [Actinomycetota bacterium]|nr:TldD/PmbA family protein [Actinomycetota bacterium]
MTDLRRNVPISPGAVRAAAGAVLELAGADAVEVVVTSSLIGLTRFARSRIIQNTVRNDVRAYVRVVDGDRVAVAATNQLGSDQMLRAGGRALEAARATPPDPDFPGLPSPSRVGQADGIFRWDETTAGASPARRAEAVQAILRASGSDNAAGVFETSAHCYSVINSLGVECFDAYTRCVTTCLVDDGAATGWGEASSHAIEAVDVERAARTAAGKASRGHDPVEAEPGTYEVILEPAASAMLMEYLSYMGMGAKQVVDGESFLASRSGERVASDEITVADDVFDDHSVGIGFDLEGVPKKAVTVIDHGRAVGPVTDLRTAPKLGLAPTGHYSGSSEFGPYASNVVLRPGDESPEELMAGVDDGFLITRFHYVNVLDRPSTLLTGMTRDGIFRIRGGEIAEPVNNFRFSQSVLEALGATSAVGNDATAFAPDYGSFGSNVAPSLRVGAFNFASTTTH